MAPRPPPRRVVGTNFTQLDFSRAVVADEVALSVAEVAAVLGEPFSRWALAIRSHLGSRATVFGGRP